MRKSLIIALSILCLTAAHAQDNEETFVRVFGKVLSQKDSSSVNGASVLYEKLPYYDDMGMGRTGSDGGFEFYLVKGLTYHFTSKNSEFKPEKEEILIADPDGDGSFSFTIYMEPSEERELITLENLIFSRGSDRITESSHQELDELVAWLDTHANMVIQLEGHTDFAGNADANMRLSQARVEAVKEYLTHKGIDKKRLLTKAFGGTQPLSTERTDEAKTKNRRVEVRVISK